MVARIAAMAHKVTRVDSTSLHSLLVRSECIAWLGNAWKEGRDYAHGDSVQFLMQRASP